MCAKSAASRLYYGKKVFETVGLEESLLVWNGQRSVGDSSGPIDWKESHPVMVKRRCKTLLAPMGNLRMIFGHCQSFLNTSQPWKTKINQHIGPLLQTKGPDWDR